MLSVHPIMSSSFWQMAHRRERSPNCLGNSRFSMIGLPILTYNNCMLNSLMSLVLKYRSSLIESNIIFLPIEKIFCYIISFHKRSQTLENVVRDRRYTYFDSFSTTFFFFYKTYHLMICII